VELKQIKELILAMGRGDLKILSIKKGDFELHLEKNDSVIHHEESTTQGEHQEPNPMKNDIEHHRAIASPTRHVESRTGKANPVSEEKESQIFVSSPMVGTFYVSTSPDSPPFVKIGDSVEKNTVVCIVEAMKVMNEVKAGVSGIVAEVLVENAHAVEFGTKLFRITSK
jgi:acetyl-CoA carboxylase biotin carboxyl carrier protein